MSPTHLPDGSQFMASEVASKLYVNEVLDGRGNLQYLDRDVSVSGMSQEAIWDAVLLDEQHRRFLNGT